MTNGAKAVLLFEHLTPNRRHFHSPGCTRGGRSCYPRSRSSGLSGNRASPTNVCLLLIPTFVSRSGTGIVSSFLGQIVGASNACSCLSPTLPSRKESKTPEFFLFSNTPTVFLCTDINLHAATCTARTGFQNKVQLSLSCLFTIVPVSPPPFHSSHRRVTT